MFKTYLNLILSIFFGLLFYQCTEADRTAFSDPENIGEVEKKLDSIVVLARLLPDTGNPARLISLYFQSGQLMQLVPDTSTTEARARLFFTNKLARAGGTQEAIKQGWKTIEISKEARLDNPNGLRYQTYGTLAGLYDRIGKTDSSRIISILALEESHRSRDTLIIAGSLNNAGIYFYQSGMKDSAMVFFLKADSLLNSDTTKKGDWVILHGSVSDNIATYYEEQGKFDKAAVFYRDNLSLYLQTDDLFRRMNAAVSLANAEIELGNLTLARQLIDSVGQMLDTIYFENKTLIDIDLLNVSIKYFERAGDPQNALVNAKKMIMLTDSLNKKREFTQNLASSIYTKFMSDRFALQLESERATQEAEKQSARLRFWIILLIASGATVTPTILLFYYRQNAKLHMEKSKVIESEQLVTQQRLKLEQKEKLLLDLALENKKKDLTDMALHLSAKQSWAKELDQRIKLIESLKGTRRSREFKALKDEIRHQVTVDNDLAVLLADMENLNAAFYEQLNDQFPGLSKTDKKLCSFIRLKLSNVQIAQIQNINPDSVRMSKHRLRAKLNLSSDLDMDEFLQSF